MKPPHSSPHADIRLLIPVEVVLRVINRYNTNSLIYTCSEQYGAKGDGDS